MQNEVKRLYLKPNVLGKVMATGAVEERNVRIDGVRQAVRVYGAMSENVATFVIWCPVRKGVAKLEQFQEIELEEPTLQGVVTTISTGRNRNQFIENVIYSKSVKAK